MLSERLYYSDAYLKEFDARVISCSRRDDGGYSVILDRTAFYPEGGGQPGDSGFIGEAPVTDTREEGGEIVHICGAPLAEGAQVRGRIDWEQRFDRMQQHSGEHIFSGMICSTFSCDNVGFHMGADTVTIDFSAAITDEELRDIESRANRYIMEGHRVQITFPSPEELSRLEYRSKKELDGEVRIVSFPGADTCACCGTHLSSSAEVGLVKVLSSKKFHEGTRIELLCGMRALDHLMKCWDQNSSISKALSAPHYGTYSAVQRLMENISSLERQAADLEQRNFSLIAAGYAGAGDTCIIMEAMDTDSMRRLCEAVHDVCGGICAVFCGSDPDYRYALMAPDSILRSLCSDMNSALNGRGGGRDGLAQGSVRSGAESIKEFFS